MIARIIRIIAIGIAMLRIIFPLTPSRKCFFSSLVFAKSILNLGIHIYDMRLILKQFPSFLYNPINMIDWEICFHNIIFCNEDYESLIQSLIQITWFGDIRINQCAVVSGPLRASTFVPPLNLYIKYTAMTIDSKNVQSYGPAL